MNEANTRKELIDKSLQQAGWNTIDQTQVITEFEIHLLFKSIAGEPQTSYYGNQFSDYVLLGKNGNPFIHPQGIRGVSTPIEIHEIL